MSEKMHTHEQPLTLVEENVWICNVYFQISLLSAAECLLSIETHYLSMSCTAPVYFFLQGNMSRAQYASTHSLLCSQCLSVSLFLLIFTPPHHSQVVSGTSLNHPEDTDLIFSHLSQMVDDNF